MSDALIKDKPEPGMVLVGFGDYDLKDMLEWIDTDKEEDLACAFIKWPPVYRREEICTVDELKAACQYLAFLKDLFLEQELQNPKWEEENV